MQDFVSNTADLIDQGGITYLRLNDNGEDKIVACTIAGRSVNQVAPWTLRPILLL